MGTVEKRRQHHGRSSGQARGARVGTYAGAPIVFTSSWIILGGLLIVLFAPIARRNWPDLGAWSYAVAGLLVAILGLSTLVHEMAHALVAHRSGLRITAINVTFWGGATHLASASPTPRTRALISGAGPVSNLVLAAISYLLWQIPEEWSILWALLAVLTFVNLFVGLLNLFPALPLDGGGLVEALIWAITKDQYTANRVTGRISQVLGVALAIAPFLWMAIAGEMLDYLILIWCVILGATMWSTGAAVRQRPRPSAVPQDIFMPAIGLSADQPVASLPPHLGSLRTTGAPSSAASGRAGLADGTYPAGPARPAAVIGVLQAADGTVTGWVEPQVASQVPSNLAASTPLSAVSQSLPAQAIITGGQGNSEYWLSIIRQLPYEVPGLVIVDQAGPGVPVRVRAAVSMERLVAALVASQR